MIERTALQQTLQQALARSRVVALIGPRQCGKTTLARRFVPPDSVNYFDLEDPVSLVRLEQPMTALSGLTGLVVIDEIQRHPELFPNLRDLARSKGSTLSGGERKMLAIGRALMANPALVLLDEPSEGLAPLVVAHLVEVLKMIRKQGVTILLADQNLRFCRKVCDRGYVLEKGRVELGGTIEEIWANEEVVAKYLVV